MKIKLNLFLATLLIFLCCISATSATNDVTDVNLTATDDVVVEQTDVTESLQSDDTQETTMEDNNIEILNSATPSTASNWNELSSLCTCSGDKEITLTGTEYNVGSNSITFTNSATIIGNANTYFTGGSSSIIPFICDDSSLSITFKNVNFKDMTSQMVMKLQGTSTLDNCTFSNIINPSGRNSVVYNDYGFMNIIGCTFVNCTSPYGAVSNYNAASVTNVRMNVTNSKFENNYASSEPGAINNCGLLNVTNSTFTKNRAALWAGAINTYTNAETIIKDSTFKSNTAGWNGGALYTYSVLKVYNSIFEDNNCSTNSGGGAIGSYNFGSQYDILVENCTFKNNYNLNGLTKTTTTSSQGRGGAIAVLNGGYLDVHNSTFIHNSAKWGQAICAYNQIIDNGTSDKPHLSICDNTFENHTYNSRDTVYINGIATAFKNNVFINSPQTQYSFGDGNTYNSIVSPILLMQSKKLLGSSIEDILGVIGGEVGPIIYVNSSCEATGKHNPSAYPATDPVVSYGKDWDDAYGGSEALTYIFASVNANLEHDPTTIILADGEYFYEDDSEEFNLAVMNINFEGYGNNVVFKFNEGYVIIHPAAKEVYGTDLDEIALDITTTYKNIIFDCSVTLGSHMFKFTDCTFKDDVIITNICNNNDWQVSFENCTFLKNAKDEIQYPEGISVTFDEDCSFKQNALESNLTITSTEKGVIIITVVDNENKPIEGLTVKYSINGTVNSTGITDANGIINIPVSGEGSIKAEFEGNENYLKSNDTFKYNFTETNTENNNGTSGNITNVTKVDTKIVASNVNAVYNAAKKLTVTLKDVNDNVLAGKNVVIKLNGKTYSNLKTNAKGQVVLSIPINLVPKTYTATITFAGDDNYNKAPSTTAKIVVAKATPKLTTKKLITKVKVKTKKVTATLKGVPKNTKVTLKIKGKTYTAKTNKKGVVTFKVTKLNKKGNFKGTIKFSGNKYFKAVSKKVTVVVKK